MERLLQELGRTDARPAVLTGAGISLASGIPTFRGTDPDAISSFPCIHYKEPAEEFLPRLLEELR